MSTRRTVLVVADSDEQDNHYQHQLQQDRLVSYQIIAKQHHTQSLTSSQLQQLDGILLEFCHPYARSLDFLRQLKEQMGDRCPPIIVIDSGDTTIAVQAFKNGAADYLVKDQLTPDDLRLAMRNAIENAELRRKLQHSQEQFQISIENMLDCFGSFSSIRDETGQIVDFRIDYLNTAACETNQMPKAMQIGRGLCEILPAHRESGLFAEYCQVVETGEPLTKDSLIFDDTYGDRRLIRAFDIRATKLNDGFVASWRDVTDRRQIELKLNQTVAALQVSQQRQHDLTEAMPQFVWTANATGEVDSWNQGWYKYTGLNQAESFGLAGVSAVHPQERDRTLEQWRQAIARSESFEIEYRIRRWDGEYRWFISRAIPTRNSQGQIIGWIGTITDIDHQKQVEIALQQSQDRLELAMKAAKIGSWDWNIQTGQIHWSTNLETLFGMAAGSFDGQYATVRAMMHPDDLPSVEQAIHRAINEGEEYNIEFRFLKPDGTVRWALGLGRVFYDASGNPVSMAGIDMDISERKQVEADLRTSEARFRDMADHAPTMIWVTDSTGHCTYLNRRWYELTGQTEETGLGFGWLDAVHPDDYEASRRVFFSANERQEAFQLDYRLRCHNGDYRWAIDAANPWFGEDGEFKGYIGSVIDISDRKQAEEALAANEVRLQAFVDANVVGILYGDIHGNMHEANDELLRIVGYTRADLQLGNLRWIDITPPEYLPRDEQGIAEARRNGACTPYEKEYIRKDGSRVPVLIGYSLVGQARENTVVFVLDLSDRKQAEAALRQSEERYRTLFESIDEGFCVIEVLFEQHSQSGISGSAPQATDYRFWETNPAFERQTGLTNAQGKRIRELVPNHEDYWFEIYGNIAQTGVSRRFENYAAALQRWYDVYAFRVGQPESHRVAVLFNNITDRKLVEQEREKLLAEEQAARAAAERANRMKDEFLTVLSHELRSPLNPILGWTKLLQVCKFDETKTAHALAIIERNAKLQTQLIDDLLDIAKILRGKMSLTVSPVNLASVIEAAIETVSTAALAKSISLHPVLPHIGQVSGDATRLQQVVWNMLSNAIKFTPNGGQVEIHLNRVGHLAELTVRDTGRGIHPDFLPYIFESFRQEDASITRKHGGLGLGLAIVRQLVEAHGGTVTADSAGEGLGATFTVYLPLLNTEPALQPREELPPQNLDLTGIRVLTVDDDPDARELITILLIQYGAEVLAVASASEVLANLTSFQPDVLVSDIGMPNMDGYTLMQQVRALPPEQGGQVPAIALTAYARDDDYQRAISSGYQRHVTKPLEPEQLVQTVITLTQPH
ncbi:PAS domain S-box protein [Oculatella sp. LEGE 06141]|uniref:PAS domain S-box protein n=1 Tax=Oculatella sp. LEGE 06141 TaxID=1828648 RepID=UPI0018830697|nr:PAS domain S-box protein [Oculatella sp. LEGE 06141]MBE9181756.1 PAS domain S-box protein [Oculatella sp. LEGE 06141]